MQNDREKFTEDNIRIYDKLNGRLIYLNKKSTRVNPHILENQNLTPRKIKWFQIWNFNIQKGNKVRHFDYKRKKIMMHYSLQSNF